MGALKGVKLRLRLRGGDRGGRETKMKRECERRSGSVRIVAEYS